MAVSQTFLVILLTWCQHGIHSYNLNSVDLIKLNNNRFEATEYLLGSYPIYWRQEASRTIFDILDNRPPNWFTLFPSYNVTFCIPLEQRADLLVIHFGPNENPDNSSLTIQLLMLDENLYFNIYHLCLINY